MIFNGMTGEAMKVEDIGVEKVDRFKNLEAYISGGHHCLKEHEKHAS